MKKTRDMRSLLLYAALGCMLIKLFYIGGIIQQHMGLNLGGVLQHDATAQAQETDDPAGSMKTSGASSDNATGVFEIQKDFTWSYDLILALQKRDAELNAREVALRKEEERIESLKRNLDTRIEKLSRLEEKIASMIDQKKAVENEKVRKLAKVFEETPPEQAGPLLSKLDVDIAAQLILKMTGRKAGRIWGFVAPEQAVRISKELARLKPGFDVNEMGGGQGKE